MLPVDFRIEQVGEDADLVLKNLFEHYLHDMAEWFGFDSLPDGSYSYATRHIWENPLDVYFAYAGRIPVGFALVGQADAWIKQPGTRDVEEFFVVRRYRRNLLGRTLANHIWSRYPGPWLVRVFQGNLPALPFWRGAVAAHARGIFGEETCIVEGNPWSYFTFDNSSG
jgi:predicted acetyltransferase